MFHYLSKIEHDWHEKFSQPRKTCIPNGGPVFCKLWPEQTFEDGCTPAVVPSIAPWTQAGTARWGTWVQAGMCSQEKYLWYPDLTQGLPVAGGDFKDLNPVPQRRLMLGIVTSWISSMSTNHQRKKNGCLNNSLLTTFAFYLKIPDNFLMSNGETISEFNRRDSAM